MPFYQKKPVVVDAQQWDGTRTSIERLCLWVNDLSHRALSYTLSDDGDVSDVQIQTLEGPLNVSPGDFIICGVQGEFYPCKPDVFEATYSPLRGPEI